MLDTLRVEWSVTADTLPWLHPGRSAHVHAGGGYVGWVGEVHPLVAREWDFEQPVAAFTIDLGRICELASDVTTYAEVSPFPPVRQDIAVIVGEDVTAQRVIDVTRAAGGALLGDAEIFDVYELGEGRRSLALHLEFRDPERTLTDEDVAPVREAIVAALASEVGGELRG